MSNTLAAQLVEHAKTKGVIIATAESCTAGLLSAAITDIAGSSSVFDRGFVTYSNAAKQEMLDVREDTLAEFGAVSQETAIEMAIGAYRASKANLTVSITGIAGPGGSQHKPEGMVCFAVKHGENLKAHTKQFGPIGRSQVRAESVRFAIKLIESAL